jgi:hypothetical protein
MLGKDSEQKELLAAQVDGGSPTDAEKRCAPDLVIDNDATPGKKRSRGDELLTQKSG